MSTYGHHGHPRHSFGSDSPAQPEMIEALFRRAALAVNAGAAAVEQVHLDELTAAPLPVVDQVSGRLLDQTLRQAWEHGWQPSDLAALTRRRGDKPMHGLLVDAIAAEATRYSPATIHPRWAGQLTDLGARVWWDSAAPRLSQWAGRMGLEVPGALRAVVRLIALLVPLPRINLLLPLPGSAATRADAGAGQVDAKVLGRIRGLLAKAESSEFPEEAEALSGKAQELMTRFSLDRAMVAATGDPTSQSDVIARRIWLDPPYVDAKSTLVGAVSRANGCRAVTYGRLGFVAVLGDELDLQLVELLTTSLLLQAGRAMLAHGSQRGRTRSFRQAFLVAFAQRISERLHAAKQAAEAAVQAAAGRPGAARLLPVLAAREARTESLFNELFPLIGRHRVSVSNAAGWAAGRTAADLASLDTRSALPD